MPRSGTGLSAQRVADLHGDRGRPHSDGVWPPSDRGQTSCAPCRVRRAAWEAIGLLTWASRSGSGYLMHLSGGAVGRGVVGRGRSRAKRGLLLTRGGLRPSSEVEIWSRGWEPSSEAGFRSRGIRPSSEAEMGARVGALEGEARATIGPKQAVGLARSSPPFRACRRLVVMFCVLRGWLAP